MSTIRNDNTTGGGMYAPSQGINTALTNPNGITSATYSNGAGFGGSAENFVTGNPFKPAPQGYTPYNPALGPTQQPLAPAPAPAPAPTPAPAPGGQMGYIPDEPGPVNADPNQAYATMCGAGVPPQEAAKHAVNGTTPPGMPGPNVPAQAPVLRESRGGQYDTGRPINAVKSGGPPPGFYGSGPGQQPQDINDILLSNLLGQQGGRQQRGGQYDTSGLGATISGGPPPGYGTGFQPSGPSPFDQLFQQPQGGSGNGTLLSNLMGPRLGGYGYGQGSNVSMMQALQGGGGQGYGDFLSQLLARYGG